jgi:formyl-CoA transferase/CoA:oxalate CoA-transferase
MDKMGFGDDRLRELKPDIILGSVSAFGQYGPLSRATGL